MKNLFKKNQLMITALAIMIAIAGYLQFAKTDLESEYLTTEGSNVADSGVFTETLPENLTSEDLTDYLRGEGLLDLSEEDLTTDYVGNQLPLGNESLVEMESLDSDVDVTMEDYLDQNMQVDDQAFIMASIQPEEGEVPGEAIFTAASGITILSEAKLLKEQTRARNRETLFEIINSPGITDEQKKEAVDSMVAMTEIAEKEAAAEILLEAKGFRNVVVSINGNGVDVVVNAVELTDAQRAQIEDIVKRKAEVSAENIIISTVVE